MIYINLLPPEELKNVAFRQKRIPVIPFLVLFFILLFLIWVFFIFSMSHAKITIHSTMAQLEEIAPRKSDVDVLWDELHNTLLVQRELIETIMQGPLEWAYVLNMISDYASQGIWLRRVALEQKDALWLLTIEGYAKPVSSRSMIKDIGNFVTDVKDNIEASVLKGTIEKKDLKDFIEVSTVTDRKKADNLELTEFITVYKIRL